MRILVTGGAGFIGSNLAKHLSKEGHDVTAVDTFLSAHWDNLVDFNGDVLTLDDRLDISSIRDLAQRHGAFDVIFHQAAMTGVIDKAGNDTLKDDFHGFMRNNVEQFRHLLDFALDASARMVWASSCSVYGRGEPPMKESDARSPLNIYGFTKLAKERLAERYAKRNGLRVVGLRYSNVYGPGEGHKGKLASMIYQLAGQMKAGNRPRIFKAGQQRRDFVYIDDVVQANIAAMNATESGVYNAGAGASWSFNEVIDELNRALGTNHTPEYFENPYGFTQDWTECDQSLAKAKLNYEPKYDLARGIQAYAASGELTA